MARSIWAVVASPAARAGSTRERLMDAAALLFYAHGFHAVGLDRILADVGVTKTTFYNHFESKDALIVALLQDRDRRDMEALHAELERRGGGARERLLAVFDVLDAWFLDQDFRGCLFFNAAAQFPNPNDPVHAAAMQHGAHLEQTLDDLARQARAGDPALLARQLRMLVGAAITTRHVGADPEAGRTARLMAEALLQAAGTAESRAKT